MIQEIWALLNLKKKKMLINLKMKKKKRKNQRLVGKKKSDSEDSSDGFQKPVDFGIDRETSFKLDKLNLMLMVAKDKDSNQVNPNRISVDSLPTTSSRDLLDSPTRNYVKNVLGFREEDLDVKKINLSNGIFKTIFKLNNRRKKPQN